MSPNQKSLRGRRQIAFMAAAATALALAAISWATGLIPGTDSKGEKPAVTEERQTGEPAAAASLPPAAAIEDCNRYAADAKRDAGRVAGEALVGGAIGAGVGAASGAIADDGKDGAKKGAGIGAIVGATAGTLHGLQQENSRTEAARTAYRECMANRGYAG